MCSDHHTCFAGSLQPEELRTAVTKKTGNLEKIRI